MRDASRDLKETAAWLYSRFGAEAPARVNATILSTLNATYVEASVKAERRSYWLSVMYFLTLRGNRK